MSDVTSVVVTGASGLIGQVLLAGLDARLLVRGVDLRRPRRQIEGRPVVRGDLRRPAVARRALTGADVVVDLAGRPEVSMSWRQVHRANLRAVWNTLEAASAVGARRVVLASSNAVVGGYEQDQPYRRVLAGEITGLSPTSVPRLTADVPIRPGSPYGVGKVMAEAAGRYFADVFGLSVIALRIGTVRPRDRPENTRHLATLLTHRDLVHLVERCVAAPDDVRFATLYGVSANTWRIWDIDVARDAVGYEPQDDAEAWRATLDG